MCIRDRLITRCGSLNCLLGHGSLPINLSQNSRYTALALFLASRPAQLLVRICTFCLFLGPRLWHMSCLLGLSVIAFTYFVARYISNLVHTGACGKAACDAVHTGIATKSHRAALSHVLLCRKRLCGRGFKGKCQLLNANLT